jgi:hypothetical protein
MHGVITRHTSGQSSPENEGTSSVNSDKITALFVDIDDFCIKFEAVYQAQAVGNGKKSTRGFPCGLSDSEIMTILIFFTCLGFATSRSII